MKWHNLDIKLALVLILVTTVAVCAAKKEICQADGTCEIMEGSCLGHYPRPPWAPTCTDQLKFDPKTDYITWLKGGQKAVVVSKKKHWNVVSDKFALFLEKIRSKYASAPKDDEKSQRSASAELAKFKKSDDGIVSAKRLERLSKETGLSIRKM